MRKAGREEGRRGRWRERLGGRKKGWEGEKEGDGRRRQNRRNRKRMKRRR